MDEKELVAKILAGDNLAYEEFHKTFRKRIYRACVFILGYRDPDAEDITQEVFLAAFRKLPTFEFRSSLYHWLCSIATYLCWERIEKRKRHVSSMAEELEALAGPHSIQRDTRDREHTQKQRALDVLETKRRELSEECRKLMDLRDVGKRSYAQLAVEMKVPIGTIMSRLGRCREALRNLVLRALGEVTHG